MTKHYPTQQDTQGADRLERVIRDLYDRVYKLEAQLKALLSKVEKK